MVPLSFFLFKLNHYKKYYLIDDDGLWFIIRNGFTEFGDKKFSWVQYTNNKYVEWNAQVNIKTLKYDWDMIKQTTRVKEIKIILRSKLFNKLYE